MAVYEAAWLEYPKQGDINAYLSFPRGSCDVGRILHEARGEARRPRQVAPLSSRQRQRIQGG